MILVLMQKGKVTTLLAVPRYSFFFPSQQFNLPFYASNFFLASSIMLWLLLHVQQTTVTSVGAWWAMGWGSKMVPQRKFFPEHLHSLFTIGKVLNHTIALKPVPEPRLQKPWKVFRV